MERLISPARLSNKGHHLRHCRPPVQSNIHTIPLQVPLVAAQQPRVGTLLQSAKTFRTELRSSLASARLNVRVLLLNCFLFLLYDFPFSPITTLVVLPRLLCLLRLYVLLIAQQMLFYLLQDIVTFNTYTHQDTKWLFVVGFFCPFFLTRCKGQESIQLT